MQKLRITKLKLGKRGKRRLTLKFSKVIGASKYTLRYRVKGKKAWKTTTVAGNKTSITLKRLKKAKRYQFQIKASYRLGDTSYTTSWSPRVTSRKIR